MFRVWIDHWPELYDPTPFVICVKKNKGRIVEFRGPPFEHEGWHNSLAGILHDNLTGPHASMLHAGQDAIVLRKHSDYERVKKLYEQE